MKSQTHFDEKSVDESVSDGWGDWVEQDPTDVSNEWFENQSSKQAEVDQAVKARLREEQSESALQKQPDVKQVNEPEVMRQQPEVDQRVMFTHYFFASHVSADSTSSTKEESKNEQNSNPSFSSGHIRRQ